eukprot:Ihof_evm14s25 gene=Ihof_evmTU14s25
MSDPSLAHWKMVQQVFAYLNTTKEKDLVYRQEPIQLTAYEDADFGGDSSTRKSTSGFIILPSNSPLSWASNKQSIVANSSTEAEYISLWAATLEVSGLAERLESLDVNTRPVKVFEYNQSTIRIAENP